MNTTLPIDSAERKNVPLAEGCLFYFPAALAGVARISKIGNDKHNPGQPMHHARGKSTDHADCVLRHLLDLKEALARFERSALNPGPSMIARMLMEADQLSWRALALSQEIHERFGAPLAPNAKRPEVAADGALQRREILQSAPIEENAESPRIPEAMSGRDLRLADGDTIQRDGPAHGPG